MIDYGIFIIFVVVLLFIYGGLSLISMCYEIVEKENTKAVALSIQGIVSIMLAVIFIVM